MNKRDIEKNNKKDNNVGFFRRLVRNFYPTYIYEKVENIPYKLITENNIRLILIDMDNTLVNNKYIYNKKLKKWIDGIKEKGVNLCIFSNSPIEDRVRRIANELGMEYKFNVSKPRIKGFKKVLEETEINKEQILMIGDQIFTDVWGGNRFGIKTILVTPIGEKEWILTKIKRPLERVVLKHYFKKKGVIK